MEYSQEGESDHEELQTALEEAEALCTHVNESVRSMENTEHLEWLQSHVQFTLDEVGGRAIGTKSPERVSNPGFSLIPRLYHVQAWLRGLSYMPLTGLQAISYIYT